MLNSDGNFFLFFSPSLDNHATANNIVSDENETRNLIVQSIQSRSVNVFIDEKRFDLSIYLRPKYEAIQIEIGCDKRFEKYQHNYLSIERDLIK